MANEQRLIDANAYAEAWKQIPDEYESYTARQVIEDLMSFPTVDAVEISDKRLLQAVKLLIKQYEHSKQSEYVDNSIAHAFFHTWKQLDKRRAGE